MSPISIALGGNCNTDFLKQHIEKCLSEQNLQAHIISLPYDNWMTAAFDNTHSFDFWIIWHSALCATKRATITHDTDETLLKSARHAKGGVILYLPPEALLAENDPFSPFVIWRKQAHHTIQNVMPNTSTILSIEHLHRKHGMDKWYDPRYWEMAKLPYHPDMLPDIAKHCTVTLS